MKKYKIILSLFLSILMVTTSFTFAGVNAFVVYKDATGNLTTIYSDISNYSYS